MDEDYLINECNQLESENRKLKKAIRDAIEYANNRESEWGERAETSFKFLYDVLEDTNRDVYKVANE